MVVGFSSAYTSPALVSMRDRNITNFDVSEQEVSIQWNFPINSPHKPPILVGEEKKIDSMRLDLIYASEVALILFTTAESRLSRQVAMKIKSDWIFKFKWKIFKLHFLFERLQTTIDRVERD